MSNKIRILFTGRYETDYNRTLIILSGLKNLGAEVVAYPFYKKSRQVRQALKNLDQQVDFIFLPCFTHLDVYYVKRHTTKPLIFDPLISRYMSKVFDYRKVWRYSVRSLKNYLKDYIMMKQADVVIADTQQHLQYYHEVIHVEKEKMEVVPVGVDVQQFYPIKTENQNQKLTVGFYGSYIPLHGIDKIVAAAHWLKDDEIAFELVGDGMTKKGIAQTLKKHPLAHTSLTPKVSYEDLNAKINSFDICLGIFGDSIKTRSVVPNKVYHYAACGKCIITRDTPAIREVFTDRQDIILTDGTAEDLAFKIKQLKEDRTLREAVGANACQLMQRRYNQDIIAQKLIDIYRKRFDQQRSS